MIRANFEQIFNDTPELISKFDLVNFFYSQDRYNPHILNAPLTLGGKFIDRIISTNREEIVINWLLDVFTKSHKLKVFGELANWLQDHHGKIFERVLIQIKNFELLCAVINEKPLCEKLPSLLQQGMITKETCFNSYAFIDYYCSDRITDAKPKQQSKITNFARYVLWSDTGKALAELDRTHIEYILSTKKNGISELLYSVSPKNINLLVDLAQQTFDAEHFCDFNAVCQFKMKYEEAIVYIQDLEDEYLSALKEQLYLLGSIKPHSELYYSGLIRIGKAAFSNIDCFFSFDSKYSVFVDNLLSDTLATFNDQQLSLLISELSLRTPSSFSNFVSKTASNRVLDLINLEQISESGKNYQPY